MPKLRKLHIRNIAVLGSGVMGLQLAAFFASLGYPCQVFGRRRSDEDRSNYQTRQQAALKNLQREKPAAFYTADAASRVRFASYEDDLVDLSTADWVLESIAEDPAQKKELYAKIAFAIAPHALLTTNTSGLPIADLAMVLPAALRSRFFATHFFNPPRYLPLLEIVAHTTTDHSLFAAFERFATQMLGNVVVRAKDTPNFIALRIGGFALYQALQLTYTGRISVATTDALTGELIGRPRSATARTADVVGLDTAIRVADNSYQQLPDDPMRDVFLLPDFVRDMHARGWLGQQSGQGFYKKIPNNKGRSTILQLDYETMTYVPLPTKEDKNITAAQKIVDLSERLRTLVFQQKGLSAEFLWAHLSAVLCYAALHARDIADDIVGIDTAVRYGFGWELGPFQLWDALGVARVAARLQKEGRDVPPLVQELLASGATSLYQRDEAGDEQYFDIHTKVYTSLRKDEHILSLPEKKVSATVHRNAAARLVELGDGVACFALESKMNTINFDTLAALEESLDIVENKYRGLVLAGDENCFSAGFDLQLILLAAKKKKWADVDRGVQRFQALNMRLRQSPFPVVAALRGIAVGGGCELAMHADQVVAAAESYIGLPEIGVGLVPAGGGCVELLRRVQDRAVDELSYYEFLKHIATTLMYGRVSGSAPEAQEFMFLASRDAILLRADHVLHAAWQAARALAASDYRPATNKTIRVLGAPAAAAFASQLYNLHEGKQISDHDLKIGTHLSKILSGGELSHAASVSDEYLYALEREAFISLLAEEKTHERIEHMLKTAKPLRN